MSHVTGPLIWNQAIFHRVWKEPNKLILELGDGTIRTMNYENWGKTVQVTEDKAFELDRGAPIRIATWQQYDPKKWFCDVDEVLDQTPLFVSELSDRWTVIRPKLYRKFDKARVRNIECSIAEKWSPLERNDFIRPAYVIDISPQDQFFNHIYPSFKVRWERANFDGGDPHIYSNTVKVLEELRPELQKAWHTLDLREFAIYIENLVDKSRPRTS